MSKGRPATCVSIAKEIGRGEDKKLIIDGRCQNPNVALGNMGWFLVEFPTDRKIAPDRPRLRAYRSGPKPDVKDPYKIKIIDQEVNWAVRLISFEPQNTGLDPSVSGLVGNALASSDCIEFARTVLNGVSSKKNPVFPANGSLIDVFSTFLSQGASHPLITRNKPSNSWGYGNPVGNIKNGDAAIFSPDGSTTGSDADTVIAELFHLAGQNKYYTDEQLAKAVHNSTYASDANTVIAPEANIFDKQHYQARGWRKDQAYSAYFHYIQMLHCTAVPQPPGHPRRIN